MIGPSARSQLRESAAATGRRPVLRRAKRVRVSEVAVGERNECGGERSEFRDLFKTFLDPFFSRPKIIKHYLSRHSEGNFLVIY